MRNEFETKILVAKNRLKKAVREYQKMRKQVYEGSTKDNLGNFHIHPFVIERYVSSRLRITECAKELNKLSRRARSIQEARHYYKNGPSIMG